MSVVGPVALSNDTINREKTEYELDVTTVAKSDGAEVLLEDQTATPPSLIKPVR